MVGSGGSDRSKEAVGMMALHEALRTVCLNSDWTYSVFWTIRPRPYNSLLLHCSSSSSSSLFTLTNMLLSLYLLVTDCRRSRCGNGCKIGDDNGSLMLMWEDGFCKGRVAECLEEIDGEDLVRKAFSKMSIQLYNYGEGWVLGRLMGKVASDKCHKWVFKEPSECDPNISNYWQSSFDAIPPEWTDQFNSGIQIAEDLHFVLRMRHTFESLGYQSGFYLSQLFSSQRNGSPSSSSPLKQPMALARPPAPIFNWCQRPLASAPNFANSQRLGLQQTKDEGHMFLLPHSNGNQMGDINMNTDHDSDIKWPNGLSFFNALTGQTDDTKLLFGSEGLGNKGNQQNHSEAKAISEASNSMNHGHPGNKSDNHDGGENANDYLSLESHTINARKMENKFKRSFTLPARMTSSSSSSSMDHRQHQHQHQPMEYRNTEAGIYSDIMETFLE
ncbi:hypothetical protein GIB67_037902 [Kingdonia uniflora]|uniref:Transcription factor MYC/MYB N-terminal domain-containing protein n=1 Tax=Kingdonia uniflora TaxID=39325 RepID=A0A7J7LHE4_9MAGN|nr:hypothetical protein GIB67_037902 [Kingdonia uniflora]